MDDFAVSGWGINRVLHLGVRGANGSALLLLGEQAAEAVTAQSRSAPCPHQPHGAGPSLSHAGTGRGPQSPGKDGAGSASVLPAAAGAAAWHG